MITNSIISLTIRRQTYLIWRHHCFESWRWRRPRVAWEGIVSGRPLIGQSSLRHVASSNRWGLFSLQIRDACFSYAFSFQSGLFQLCWWHSHVPANQFGPNGETDSSGSTNNETRSSAGRRARPTEIKNNNKKIRPHWTATPRSEIFSRSFPLQRGPVTESEQVQAKHRSR